MVSRRCRLRPASLVNLKFLEQQTCLERSYGRSPVGLHCNSLAHRVLYGLPLRISTGNRCCSASFARSARRTQNIGLIRKRRQPPPPLHLDECGPQLFGSVHLQHIEVDRQHTCGGPGLTHEVHPAGTAVSASTATRRCGDRFSWKGGGALAPSPPH